MSKLKTPNSSGTRKPVSKVKTTNKVKGTLRNVQSIMKSSVDGPTLAHPASIRKAISFGNLKEVRSVIKRLVSVTDLGRGKATKVISDITKNKEPYIVLKNNKPSAAIIGVEQLNELLDIQEKYYLWQLAEERLNSYDSSKTLNRDQVLNKYGITEAEIDAAMDSLEFE